MAPQHYELGVYVVTRNPSDYPGKHVVRRHRLTREGASVPDREPVAVVDSLEQARLAMPLGLVPVGRDPNDDPVIVEVWL